MQPLDEANATTSGTGTPAASPTTSATGSVSSTGAAVPARLDVSSSGLLAILGLGLMAIAGGVLVL